MLWSWPGWERTINLEGVVLRLTRPALFEGEDHPSFVTQERRRCCAYNQPVWRGLQCSANGRSKVDY